jgi:hypothetical protein
MQDTVQKMTAFFKRGERVGRYSLPLAGDANIGTWKSRMIVEEVCVYSCLASGFLVKRSNTVTSVLARIS